MKFNELPHVRGRYSFWYRSPNKSISRRTVDIIKILENRFLVFHENAMKTFRFDRVIEGEFFLTDSDFSDEPF